MSAALTVRRVGHCVEITLSRPSTANAIDAEMARALMDVAIECDEDPRVRAVLLTGEGAFFCGGGNLKSFAEAGPSVGALLKELTVYFHAALSRFARMRPPLVVAVNGPAAGAGFSLAICGDIVLASERASFSAAYTRVGLTPDGGLTYQLPRLVGLRRAQELLLTNRNVSAEEAAVLGLVTRVVPANELMTEARAIAGQLVAGPLEAHATVKRHLLECFSSNLEGRMELESRALAAQAASAEGREGIAAFLERRTATFLPEHQGSTI